jgi:hypothetical protein|eukprot:590486-Prymnesium_polylepis.1
MRVSTGVNTTQVAARLQAQHISAIPRGHRSPPFAYYMSHSKVLLALLAHLIAAINAASYDYDSSAPDEVSPSPSDASPSYDSGDDPGPSPTPAPPPTPTPTLSPPVPQRVPHLLVVLVPIVTFAVATIIVMTANAYVPQLAVVGSGD